MAATLATGSGPLVPRPGQRSSSHPDARRVSPPGGASQGLPAFVINRLVSSWPHQSVDHRREFRPDDPARTSCLVRRYARFGDFPIVDRFGYENPRPDRVEETTVKAVSFLRGTPDGTGILVVNSAREPEYLLKFLPDPTGAKLATFVVVDAVGLAEQRASARRPPAAGGRRSGCPRYASGRSRPPAPRS